MLAVITPPLSAPGLLTLAALSLSSQRLSAGPAVRVLTSDRQGGASPLGCVCAEPLNCPPEAGPMWTRQTRGGHPPGWAAVQAVQGHSGHCLPREPARLTPSLTPSPSWNT